LDSSYGLAGATLERIGAFVVMWATFETDLERALWRLTGEAPNGQVVSRIFRTLGLVADPG